MPPLAASDGRRARTWCEVRLRRFPRGIPSTHAEHALRQAKASRLPAAQIQDFSAIPLDDRREDLSRQEIHSTAPCRAFDSRLSDGLRERSPLLVATKVARDGKDELSHELSFWAPQRRLRSRRNTDALQGESMRSLGSLRRAPSDAGPLSGFPSKTTCSPLMQPAGQPVGGQSSEGRRTKPGKVCASISVTAVLVGPSATVGSARIADPNESPSCSAERTPANQSASVIALAATRAATAVDATVPWEVCGIRLPLGAQGPNGALIHLIASSRIFAINNPLRP